MRSEKILIANVKPFTGVAHKDADLAKTFNTLHFPINLAIIAGRLRDRYAIDVFDTYVDHGYDDLLRAIGSNRYLAVLISGYLGNYSYKFLKTFAADVKAADASTLLILGGPMASAIPEQILRHTRVDFVVTGEGEETVVALLDHLRQGLAPLNVSGVWGHKDGRLHHRAAERLRDLDRFGLPAYDLFNMTPYLDYLRDTNRCFEILGTRGCFGTCAYCCRVFKGFIARNSPGLVVRHMEHIRETLGISRFNFVDDNFLNDKDAVYEFLRELKNSSARFGFRFQGRADRLDLKMLTDLTEVGLFGISFGIESGSPDMLRTYCKPFDVDRVADVVAQAGELVEVHTTFILGGPGESRATIDETKRFLKKARIKNAAFGILTLFPGTKLYAQALAGGVIQDEDRYLENLGPVYEYPYTNISGLSDRQLLDAKTELADYVAELNAASPA